MSGVTGGLMKEAERPREDPGAALHSVRPTEAAEALHAVSRSSVERRSDALGEPDWLRERRLAAWDAYERLPVPDTRSDAWRYTDLSRLRWQETRLVPPRAERPDRASERLRDSTTASGAVELEDGEPRGGWLDGALAARGVVFTDLATALREHEDLLRPHLLRAAFDPELGKFAALHGALLHGGVFLHVPAGVEVPLPLHCVRSKRYAGGATFPHTLIVAEAGSRVTFLEESLSDTLPDLALSCSATEILAQEGARVRVATLQEWGRHVFAYSLQRARVGRDATVDSLGVTLGGRLSRVEVQSLLEAQGGTSEMLGLYLGADDQHMDHHTLQLHRAPHTNSDLLFKGALRDRSRSAFSGLIKVSKGAQRTDAYQKNRNLLLSPEARADSLPNLEIEANDVRCSHGATIGQADELQLFYLMSRGLPRQVAERMLVLGFFEEVLARVPLPLLRERVRAAVERKTAPAPATEAA
ncbi:MAG: Fe-S cluster assembly protein SufD [Gemmatimonadota bacterium]